MEVGFRLYRAFVTAGLPVPDLMTGRPISGDPYSPDYRYTASRSGARSPWRRGWGGQRFLRWTLNVVSMNDRQSWHLSNSSLIMPGSDRRNRSPRSSITVSITLP